MFCDNNHQSICTYINIYYNICFTSDNNIKNTVYLIINRNEILYTYRVTIHTLHLLITHYVVLVLLISSSSFFEALMYLSVVWFRQSLPTNKSLFITNTSVSCRA